MKKTLLNTALILSLSSVAAYAEVDLRFSWWGGNSRHEATLAAVDAYQKANPDIKIKSEYTGFSGHQTRKITEFAGRTEPDLMQINWNWLPQFTPKGDGFYDLNALSNIIDLAQFDQSSLNAVTINGKLNGIPIGVNGRIMFYNKETWDKAGITDIPQTWEDLKAAGKTFQEKLGDDYYPLLVGGEGQAGATLLRSYIVQKYGKSMIDEENKQWGISEEEMVDMFRFYQELIDNHVMPTTKTYLAEGVADEFESPNWVKGYYGGVYIWPTVTDKYADVLANKEALILGGQPMLPDAKASGIFFKPSMLFSIKRDTKYPEETAKFLNYLLNEEDGVKILGLSRGVPLSKAALQVLDSEGLIKGLQVTGIDYVIAQDNSVATSVYFDDSKLYSLFNETIANIDYGKSSIEEAAADYYKKGNRIIKRAIK